LGDYWVNLNSRPWKIQEAVQWRDYSLYRAW
jgi:hypothetical protein